MNFVKITRFPFRNLEDANERGKKQNWTLTFGVEKMIKFFGGFCVYERIQRSPFIRPYGSGLARIQVL